MNRSMQGLLVCVGSLAVLSGCGGGGNSTPPPMATSLSVTALSANATAGAALNVTVQALSASGTVVSNYSGSVHFVSTDPQAVLPKDSPLTNGSATFSVTFKTAGSQQITVTDLVSNTITGAAAFTVGPAAAAQLSLVTPTAATTGIVVNVAVSASDAYGNMATTYSGTLHFTSSDTRAILPADTLLTGGSGSLPVTLKTTGSQTITATDTATAALKATSNSINVVTNTATHFGFSIGGNAGTRASLNFTMNALDAANNISMGYAGTVHFTSSDSQAQLPPDSPLTAGLSGSLSLVFETAGTQTIVATDTKTAALNGTSSISVTATAAPSISSGVPPTGTVGTNYGPFRPQSYKCVSVGPRWNCAPCSPGFLFCGSFPPCYSSSPCILRSFVFAGFRFQATAGVPSYSWTASGMPPGLTVAANGNILGTPTSPGSYNITAKVTDSGVPPAQTTQNYTLVINNPAPPNVNATPPPPGVQNQPYAFTFTASGYGTLTWSESGALPTGLAFDNVSGALSGTPTQTGSFPISVTATDQFKQGSTPANFTIVVTAHGFVATGSMATARRFHTATLLGNGKVLVAGGEDAAANAYASAELYDPVTGTFSATGSMTVPRVGHTATLLANGQVLITGGTSDASEAAVSSAELYDPASGTFTGTTGNMTAARVSHTATLLKDGTVLVVGGDGIFFNGVQNSNILSIASAEIFNPKTGTFAATGSLAAARESHTATLLNDGRVLVSGGSDGAVGNPTPVATVLGTVELFDPAAGHFSAAGMMTTPRDFHTATLLGSGKVLLAGGIADSSTFLASAELFDPNSNSFTATGNLTAVRFYQDATLLTDGTVLLSGGNDSSGALATAEIYNPAAGTFATTGNMSFPRVWHTSTLLNNGKVLVTGGGASPYATAELYF